MSEKTFRCGWRVHRMDDGPFFRRVVVRRGEWQMVMPIEMFDSMEDADFAYYIRQAYQAAAVDQMERDLDVLARQLIGELEQGNGMIVTGAPYDDIKAALYRWQKAKRDTEEGVE